MEATAGAEATSANKWQEWAARHQALLLGLCVLIALLLRLYALFAESFVARDAVYYLDLAEKWSRADFASLLADDPRLHVLPMYCFLVKLAIQAGMGPLAAALAVSVTLGTALVPVMYGCGRALFDSRGMGLLTALLTAAHPIFVELSAQVFREDAMLLGLGAALWLAVKGEKKLHWWLWSGVGVAFAILSRYEALEAVGAAGVYLGLNWALGVAKWRGQIAKYGCFLLGVALGLALFSLIMGVPWRFYDVNFFNRVKGYLCWSFGATSARSPAGVSSRFSWPWPSACSSGYGRASKSAIGAPASPRWRSCFSWWRGVASSPIFIRTVTRRRWRSRQSFFPLGCLGACGAVSRLPLSIRLARNVVS